MAELQLGEHKRPFLLKCALFWSTYRQTRMKSVFAEQLCRYTDQDIFVFLFSLPMQ